MAYIRNNLMEAIVDKLEAVEAGDDFTMGYRFVTRDPIGHENVGKINPGECIVGVYDINEEKARRFSTTDSDLTVVVEFYYMPKGGQSKAQYLNFLLADITKALTLDQTINNTAILCQDVSNNIDIDGIYDKIINGSITFIVKYRHGLFDPTKAIC